MNWFGGQFAFSGHERWQLWFDNPNKAAVFLVELALLGLVMTFAKGRRRAFVGFLLFMLPSLAMVQTFSRGGLVSWIAAVCFVMWRRVRECGWSRRVVVIVGTVLLVFASCMDQGLSRRMAFGLSGDDRSVVNRFDIWSKVPQMIHDAPWGWGLGNSGSAYMNWYQPLGRFERYRTLVNSHLTWAVETGWVGLFAWLVMWGGIIRFNCCVGMRFSRWLCFAEWMCFAAAGGFSSVMESPWLWAVPVAATLREVAMLRGEVWACLRICSVCGLRFGCLLTTLTFAGVKMCSGDSRVSKSAEWVEYRGNRHVCWVVSDVDVLGGKAYPRILREMGEERELVTFRFVDDALRLPTDAGCVVFCGKSNSCGRRGNGMSIWLSPSADAAVVQDDVVIVGEFSSVAQQWQGYTVIEILGAGDFVPSWPSVLSRLISGEDSGDI